MLDRERPEGLYLKFSEPMMEPNTPVIIERVNGDCTVSQFIIARDEAYKLVNQLCEFLPGSPRKVGEDGALATYLLNTSAPDWEYDKVISLAAESLSLSSLPDSSQAGPIEPPAEIANLITFHEKETDVWAEQLVKARERIAELEARASSEIREARLKALEEARQICIAEKNEWLKMERWVPADAADNCEIHIRALIRETEAPSRQGAGGG